MGVRVVRKLHGEAASAPPSSILAASLLVSAAALWSASSFAAGSPLADAARANDTAKVRQLLASGAKVDLPASDGSTALLWAVYNDRIDTVNALIAAGANVDAANAYGVTPLLQASRGGDPALIKTLLDAGADVHATLASGETPLMAAARTGRVDAIRALLAGGADPNAADAFQQETALMWAAAEGHLGAVDALLDAGADPNAQAHVNALKKRKNADFPSGGFTALMWAVRGGHEAIVEHLVKGGAKLSLRNGDGLTAMMIAVINDRLDLAAKLLELGADANDGSLFYAVKMRDATTDWYAHDGSRLWPSHANRLSPVDLIERLLDAGADPNKPFVGELHVTAMCCDPEDNATPFYRAAIAADVDVLKLLLAHGAALDWTPSKVEGGKRGANAKAGQPVLIAAAEGGYGTPPSGGPGNIRERMPTWRDPGNRSPADAVRLLLDAGADPNAAAPDGTTPLHAAVAKHRLDVVRVLVAGGAKLDARNKDGLTPLDLAEGRHAKGAKAKPMTVYKPLAGDDVAKPEEIAAALREYMKKAGVAIVRHGEAAPALARNDAR
jgi:ankyrin repeat protein